MNPKATENLFSYGTLQQEENQLATFSRAPEVKPDVLVGYRVTKIPVQDQSVIENTGDTHYRHLQFTSNDSDLVPGIVLSVTCQELEQCDKYEADADYKRVLIELRSGLKAWVYLHNPEAV
jgi:gamma-glutamylcyclotransferase (GGCT)/AIG2-like uncharacterized protein YtfP